MLIVCPECTYAFDPEQNASCPNPACWPGYSDWLAARQAWVWERDSWVDQKSREARGFINTSAFREFYERDHPAPDPAAFKKEPA